MSPCLITRRYFVSTRQSQGEQASIGDSLQGSCDSSSVTRQIRLRVPELGSLIWRSTKKGWQQLLDTPEAIFRSLCGFFTPLEKRCTMKGIKGQSKDVKWQTRSTICSCKMDVAVSESLSGQKGLLLWPLFSPLLSDFLDRCACCYGRFSKLPASSPLTVSIPWIRSVRGESESTDWYLDHDQELCWLLAIWSIPC